MSYENKPIPAVEEEKDLGVTYDQKIKFSNHVDGIFASANHKLGVIKRTFSTTFFILKSTRGTWVYFKPTCISKVLSRV